MVTSFTKLPDSYQGLIYILTGAVIVLYALGIIQKGLNVLVIGFGIYAMLIGCHKLGLVGKKHLPGH